MSKSAERAQTSANSIVRNTTDKGSKEVTEGPPGFLPDDRLREICEKHYNQILPIMAEKVHKEKLQGVRTRLTYGESSRQKSQAREKNQLSKSESCDKEKRTKKRRYKSLNVMTRDSHQNQSPIVFSRLRHGESSSTRRRSPFDTLSPESIDSYDALRKAFLGNFLQQNMYIKDPVEIHHIKQREEESTKAFMKCFKAKSRHVNGASECMSISGFMHGITNPDLIKHLNDNILKSVDKMMGMTTTFLKGEVYPAYQDPKRDSSNGHGEIQGTPTKSGPAENMNKSKFYEFHRDKGHSTDEYIHLKKQLEEAVRSGQLSHLIKDLKKGNNKVDHTKTSKKGEAPNKEKAPAIFMVQP
ncbi:reverse transcriptase domain-containing protein [Tanacetum coccineum]